MRASARSLFNFVEDFCFSFSCDCATHNSCTTWHKNSKPNHCKVPKIHDEEWSRDERDSRMYRWNDRAERERERKRGAINIWNDILTECGNIFDEVRNNPKLLQIVWHRYAHCARTHTCTKTFYLYGMHFTRGAQAHTHSCPPTSQPSTHSHAHALRHPYFIFMSLKSFL